MPLRDQFLCSMKKGREQPVLLQEKSGGKPRRITDGKSRKDGPGGRVRGTRRPGHSLPMAADYLYVAAPGDAHFVRRFKEHIRAVHVAPLVARVSSGDQSATVHCPDTSLNRRTK